MGSRIVFDTRGANAHPNGNVRTALIGTYGNYGGEGWTGGAWGGSFNVAYIDALDALFYAHDLGYEAGDVLGADIALLQGLDALKRDPNSIWNDGTLSPHVKFWAEYQVETYFNFVVSQALYSEIMNDQIARGINPLSPEAQEESYAYVIDRIGIDEGDSFFDFLFSGIAELRLAFLEDIESNIDFLGPLIELFGFMTNRSDPLIIDLDGDGVNTTSVEDSSATFDLDNNGSEETVGWFEAEDGAIAHDWKGTSNADGSVMGNGRIQDRSELFATFAELSRHDVNGDGVLDANDVAAEADTDVNGDGVIDENDKVQPTVIGDFDGNGTLETIAVGWDQLQVWIDADSDGNTDDGELHSFEELGITSIDLDATKLDIENNDNIINSESTVTFDDGTSSVVNGVDFNRDTLNQSYQPQIEALDLSPDRLADRLDVFTLPQLQGVGNVPHLMIAALADDDVLNAWRAVGNYEGGSPAEFRSLVEELLLTWSGGDDLAQEYRGTVPGSILNAIEEFLGVEYPRPDETLRSFAQTELALDAWGGFVDAVTLRFYVQNQDTESARETDVSYDFTQDKFEGDWNDILSNLEAAYTDVDITADDKKAILSLFDGIFSATTREGESQDLNAAVRVQEILSEINTLDPTAEFFEEFVIGYSDGPNDPETSITTNSNGSTVSITYYPPGVDFDTREFGVNSIQSYSTIFDRTDMDPDRLSDWTNDALLIGNSGADVFDVSAAFNALGSQTLVRNNNIQGESTLYVGSAINLEFSRDATNLIIRNLETDATVLVERYFGTSVYGVSYVLFDGVYGSLSSSGATPLNQLPAIGLEAIINYDDPGEVQSFLDNSWNYAETIENAWYRGSDLADYIQGSGRGAPSGNETFVGGLGDDIIAGSAGGDTYIYRLGDGNDTIDDSGSSLNAAPDVLVLEDIFSDQVELFRRGNDLIVLLLESRQEITIERQFLLGNIVLGIEEIQFADDVTYTRGDINNSLVFSGTDGSDLINPPNRSETLVGGTGDDILSGSRASDTYIYEFGDGNDVIFDSSISGTNAIDVLELVDLNFTDIALQRDGENLTIIVQSTGEEITVVKQFISGFRSAGLEQIVFANGDVWDRDEIDIRINAPRVDAGIGIQTTQEDTEWQFEISEDAFVDPDGQTLEYSAELTNGEELPDWITFDGSVFTGTPPLNFNGELQIALTASDGTRETVSEFILNVEPVNDVPEISTELLDVSSMEDEQIDFTIPAASFVDADGDTLVLSATLADGAELPSWLVFDPNDRSFSGIPPLNFNGSLSIVVSASDGETNVSDTFDLDIVPANDAPVATSDRSGMLAGISGQFNVTLDDFDVDGDSISLVGLNGVAVSSGYSTTLESGAIVSITSNNAIQFNTNGAYGYLAAGESVIENFTYTISDDSGATSTAEFNLTITGQNDAPVLVTQLMDQSSFEDQEISFTIPADTFADIDGDDLTLQATLSDGSDLPTWLTFDTQTLTFSGTPPLNINGDLSITVTASDGEFEVSDTFDLTVQSVNDAPAVSAPLENLIYANGEVVSFAIPNDAFSDVDGDTLTISASLSDGADLPEWLTFDNQSLQFTGEPPSDFSGVLTVQLSASDGSLDATNTFDIEVLPGEGDASGFELGAVNDFYNPAWGGGFMVTFDYTINNNSVVDDSISAWMIDSGYTGDGTIMNAWATGFPGGASFNAEDGTFGNTSQNYQPELLEGTRFAVTFQVDGAGFDENDFAPEFFDEDPELFLASADDVMIDAAPTNDWGSGFVQNVEVTNTSQNVIDQWSVILDLPDDGDIQLNNVWGATAETLANGDIQFTGLSWNESIDPSGTSNFGFVASYTNLEEVQFEDDDFVWSV